jgi:hypothetical protein
MGQPASQGKSIVPGLQVAPTFAETFPVTHFETRCRTDLGDGATVSSAPISEVNGILSIYCPQEL